MRYRRYYSTKMPDGSRVVVRHGLGFEALKGTKKLFLWWLGLSLFVLFVGWPWDLPRPYRWPVQIAWIVFLIFAVALAAQRWPMKPPAAPSAPPPPKPKSPTAEYLERHRAAYKPDDRPAPKPRTRVADPAHLDRDQLPLDNKNEVPGPSVSLPADNGAADTAIPPRPESLHTHPSVKSELVVARALRPPDGN